MSESSPANEQKSARRQVLAGFEIISRVGRGGMGTVYKARQLSMDRIIALKILAPRLVKNRGFVKRFFEEARAAAKLNHPNIVQAIDAGEAEGYYYFAMEFVDGETIHRIVTREGVMDEKRALRIALDVARGLDHAFTYGLVHRDVKPGNMMIARDGMTKLCDLGLAIEMADEVAQKKRRFAVGTPYYISPEVAEGTSRGDARSDIYSLGASLFRMLCGQTPYDGATPAEILHKHVHDPVPWPRDLNAEVSESVCYVLIKMLAKDPEERYATPSELMGDLRLVLAGRPLDAGSVQIQVPVARGKESGAGGDAAARAKAKREGLEKFIQVREAIEAVAQEQDVSKREVLSLLRGNLDESQPETFLKYGLIALSNRSFRQARADFKAAARLGAKTTAFAEKLDLLGAPRDMALVSGGRFVCGPPDNEREEELPGFYMDVYPVTNAQYKEYLDANGAEPPPDWQAGQFPDGMAEHPVANITWDEAAAYARWAKKRLPSELEWEKAARGMDGNVFPWGNRFDPKRCDVKESGIGRTVPVTTLPAGASPFGCYHMAGNVRQWTATKATTPQGAEGEFRVVRGASHKDPEAIARCYARNALKRDDRSPQCGFRCARDV